MNFIDKMFYFCDSYLNDSAFYSSQKGCKVLNKVCGKGVPFVNRQYTKGVPIS